MAMDEALPVVTDAKEDFLRALKSFEAARKELRKEGGDGKKANALLEHGVAKLQESLDLQVDAIRLYQKAQTKLLAQNSEKP
jgi:exonuclease VII small subunit